MSEIELSDTDIEKSMFLNFENFLKLLLEKGETKESILKLSEIEKRIFDENNVIKKEIIRIENHLKNIEDSKNNPVYDSYFDYLNKLTLCFLNTCLTLIFTTSIRIRNQTIFIRL